MTERTFTFPRYEMAAPILGMQERHLKIIVEELPCQVAIRCNSRGTMKSSTNSGAYWKN